MNLCEFYFVKPITNRIKKEKPLFKRLFKVAGVDRCPLYPQLSIFLCFINMKETKSKSETCSICRAIHKNEELVELGGKNFVPNVQHKRLPNIPIVGSGFRM